jgi:carbon-monoxide dehydrogenase medium subunit
VKPAPFDYEAPTTLDAAVAGLTDGIDAKLLAGGQSLIPILSLRLAKFDRLVDLRRVDELRRIEIDDTRARIGAMVTQAAAEHDERVGAAVPLLPLALANVGHFQVRNRGTIGGSIAHADPAAELPAVALALGATMEIAGPAGRRDVDATDFFETTFTTAVGDDEILSAVTFPVWGPGAGFAVEEVARRHGDFALVGAVCGVQIADGVVHRAAIGMFGMGATPLRASAAEADLSGASADGIDSEQLGRAAVADLDPPSDIHATGAYRRSVGAHVVARAVRRAVQEAANG